MKNNLVKTSELTNNAGVLSDKANQFKKISQELLLNKAEEIVNNPLQLISVKV